MRVRNHGKYTHMRKNNPRAIARCDYSGFMVAFNTLKDQYQYRGQGLVNTGYKVDPHFWDEPNPQDLTPLIKADPVPLVKPRPDNIIDNPSANIQLLQLDVSGDSNITLTPSEASNINFIFTGILTGDVIIFVPGSFNIFFVTNNTTGGFSLFMQITNNSSSLILLTPNQTMYICNDGYTLLTIHPN